MQFSALGLSEPILRAISGEGYTVATAIQAQAIPPILEGRDVLGSAQTGTGKTAAFALPILHRLAAGHSPAGHRKARCLVLCPTRELATQIVESFRVYGRNLSLRHTSIYGGVSQHRQVQALRADLDIIVATPGRLMDLMEQGHVDLRNIQSLILDEADRMLDMGFIHDIRHIAQSLPATRQTLLFSATMPREIRTLADTLLKNPATVQIAASSPAVELVEQSVYHVDGSNKPVLLAHLFRSLPMKRAIVFTRTKHGADRVVRHLLARGIAAEAIHGNKSQNARERALAKFRENRVAVLVATDIASRGIDVDGVSHVVNYDITHEPETYVHRIGRTARAGAAGAAVAFCSRDEAGNLRAIERLLKKAIPVKTDHPDYSAAQPVDVAQPREHSHRRKFGQPREGGFQPRPAARTGGARSGGSHPGPTANRSHANGTSRKHRSGAR